MDRGLRWVGWSDQALLITEIYPGLLDGLQPSLSFTGFDDAHARLRIVPELWRKSDSAVWTDAKKTAVEGYTKGTCARGRGLLCGVHRDQRTRLRPQRCE